MKHESKALDSLDKIIDLIWHEEGRLAIINRYGAYLSDEEKAQATQLITNQKVNMDRLFTIYRDELLPLMHDVRRNSEAMEPLFDKLLTSAMMARQMSGEQNVTAENTVIDAVRQEDDAMQNGTALINNADIFLTAPAEAAAIAGNGEVADSVVATDGGETAVVEGGEAAVEAGSEVVADSGVPVAGNETPVMTEATGDAQASNEPVVDGNGVHTEAPVVAFESPAATEGVSTEANAESSEAVLSNVEEEIALPFVLSPIDEDVAPAVSEEEAKRAEETIAEAVQQLGAIDAVKTDIMASTELTEEEKTEKLEQYTRISDVAVKAILVTKAQCEKLLASRASQKALLKPAEAAVAEASEGVVALPDLAAGEGEAVVALPAVSEEGATTEEKNEVAGDGLVLPMIGGEAPAGDTPAADTSSEVTASDLVLEIPGVAATDTPAEAQNSQGDLQAMIEQANALYKEGKVAEAQALFEKIGTMNKEAQGGDTSAVAEDAAVLVKK